MENQEYQKIFNAFNACTTNPQKSSAAQDFVTFSATPEAMLKTFETIRTIATKDQLRYHKSSYLRGLMMSLGGGAWNQSHAAGLINATDWLISLRETAHHYTNYLQKVRILVETVQQKITVPNEKKQEWAHKLASKRANKIPQCNFGQPVEIYGRPYKTSYRQSLIKDDRN